MAEHSPEPWQLKKIVRTVRITDANGDTVAVVECHDSAESTATSRRIVACVNACVGIATEVLEAGFMKHVKEAIAWRGWAQSDAARQGRMLSSLEAKIIEVADLSADLGHEFGSLT